MLHYDKRSQLSQACRFFIAALELEDHAPDVAMILMRLHRFDKLSIVFEKMNLTWVHPMHGGSFQRDRLPNHAKALRDNEFAYGGMFLGREIAKVASM